MKKSFWLAMLAYLVPTFPLGYFWHLVTFREAYERLDIFRAEVVIPFGLASMALQAIFFAWSYPRLFSYSATSAPAEKCLRPLFSNTARAPDSLAAARPARMPLMRSRPSRL